MRKTSIITLIAVILAFILSGCAAMTTAIEHRNLEINSKMSNTVFLDPVSAELKTVLVQVKNTTDKDMDIKNKIISNLTGKGYTVVTDPGKAHYWLQVNILYAGKAQPQTIQSLLAAGYGASLPPVVGGLLGAAAGGSMHNSSRGYMTGGALGMMAGGLLDTAANAMVKSVTYSVVTDVQISEKSDVAVEQEIKSDLSQGSETKVRQVIKSTSNFKRYKTRIASTANQVNLKFEAARPQLEAAISKQIAGIM